MKTCSICGGNHYGKGLCQKHYDAEKYKKNKDTILARHKKFVANNPSYYKEHRKNNAEKYRAAAKKYVENNKEKVIETTRKTRAKNRDKILAYGRAYRDKNRDAMRAMWRDYHGRNLAKHRTNVAARNAMKLQSIPKWTDAAFERFAFEEASDLAERREVAAKFAWHVDHIVPLRSKTVCGLHRSANWQVIPATINQVKGNRVWPDMP